MAYTDIDDPSAYFQTTLYTGDGNGSGQAITHGGNSDLQADWIWIKNRTDAENHSVTDSVRGANKGVLSNSSDAESTDNSNGYLSSFNSDGFTTANAGVYNNASSKNYVSWNWKETATAGFDIVSYTGSGSAKTVSHSLSAVPKMIIVKARSSSGQWAVQHGSLGATKWTELDSTAATDFSTTIWNNTEPTSSVFTVGTNARTNANGTTYIAYVFAEKKGYSKFGSYVGNGNADGSFIWTGQKSAFVIVKRSVGGTGHWMMLDNKRSASGGFNVLGERIKANATDAGATDVYMDFLASGFKFRTTTATSWNDSGSTYIFMSFAENPFTTSTGVPATAR